MGPELRKMDLMLTTAMFPHPDRPFASHSQPTPLYENITIPPLLSNNVSAIGQCKSFITSQTTWNSGCCQKAVTSDPFIVNIPDFKDTVSVNSSGSCSSNDKDFTLDSSSVSFYSCATKRSAEEELVLLKTEQFLQQCLFYYKGFLMNDARIRLADSEIGSFLLRPSSDPNHLVSLSVKTSRGTTSVRIAFRAGRFCLDSDPSSKQDLPTFESVPKLIEFYLRLSISSHKNRVMFLEASGRKDTPISLRKPCLRAPGSLKHLSRIAIHGSISDKRLLHQLPGASTQILDFLQSYPHSV